MFDIQSLDVPELLQLFEEVKLALQDQGKEWHSLERWQWMEGGIKFWLNPNEQDLYNSGWFSIDELIAWSHDLGPVMIEEPEAEEIQIPVAKPEPVVVARAIPAQAPRRERKPRSMAGSKGKAAFTLRLDPDRHLKLRLACAVDGRSAQMLVTQALDKLLADMPELDAMATKAKRKG